MKRNLLLGVAFISCANFMFAQTKLEVFNKVVSPIESKNGSTAAKALGTTFWHDNFDSLKIVNSDDEISYQASNWTIANTGGTQPYHGFNVDNAYTGWYFTGATGRTIVSASQGKFIELTNGNASPTSANGAGGAATNVSYTITSPVIDVATLTGSATPGVILTFQQDGFVFNDYNYVEISTDGTSWTVIHENSAVKENQVRYGSATAADMVEVDLTSILANAASTVQLRFRWESRFPTSANIMAWATYGWLIDDIKLSTKADYDLVHVTSGWESVGYEYSQIPLAQVSELTFSTYVKNQGSSALTNVKLDIAVTETGASYSSPAVTLAANTYDSLQATFTPAAVGTYTVTRALTMTEIDDVASNNAAPSSSFIVGTNTYAVDKNSTFTDFPLTTLTQNNNPVVVTGIGTSYDIYADAMLHGIDFRFFTGSPIGSTVYAEIYQYDEEVMWDGPLTESEMFQLETASQISQIQTVKFEDPFQMEAGKTYLALLKTVGTDVKLAASGSTTRQQAWIKTTNSDPWGRFTAIPVVRLNFNPALSVEANDIFTSVTMFPNPAAEATTVEFNANAASDVVVEVVDVTGKVVNTVVTKANAGTNKVNINVAELATGVYTVAIKSNDSKVTKKLTVK